MNRTPTLHTLDEFTAVEIIDFVSQKLHEQGTRSSNGSNCVYRTFDGRKCAVGHLMSDKEYAPEMDWGLGMSTVQIFRKLDITTRHMLLLSRLQSTHDVDLRGDDFEAFDRRIAELREEFKE